MDCTVNYLDSRLYLIRGSITMIVTIQPIETGPNQYVYWLTVNSVKKYRFETLDALFASWPETVGARRGYVSYN